MAEAITHIQTITPSGSTNAMQFTSIPVTYDDLLLIGTLKGQSTSHWAPNDTGNNFYFGNGGSNWNTNGDYAFQQLYDQYSGGTFQGYQNNYTGAGVADKIRAYPIPGSQNDTYTPGAWYLYVPGYAVTTNSPGRNFQMFGGCVSNSTNALQYVQINAGMIEKSDAITDIWIYSGTGNYTTSSKMSLYGIKNT